MTLTAPRSRVQQGIIHLKPAEEKKKRFLSQDTDCLHLCCTFWILLFVNALKQMTIVLISLFNTMTFNIFKYFLMHKLVHIFAVFSCIGLFYPSTQRTHACATFPGMSFRNRALNNGWNSPTDAFKGRFATGAAAVGVHSPLHTHRNRH